MKMSAICLLAGLVAGGIIGSMCCVGHGTHITHGWDKVFAKNDNVKKHIEGKTIVKTIVIKNKIVNIVVK